MPIIPDGIYSIEVPFGGGAITDTGEGRYCNLLPPGALGPDANKVNIYPVLHQRKVPILTDIGRSQVRFQQRRPLIQVQTVGKFYFLHRRLHEQQTDSEQNDTLIHH